MFSRHSTTVLVELTQSVNKKVGDHQDDEHEGDEEGAVGEAWPKKRPASTSSKIWEVITLV